MPEGTITIPHNWSPRPYQRRLWDYLSSGGKRAVAVWHRRAGKDDVMLHNAACAALERQGNYWHMLPEAAQSRKAIWDAINPHTGKRRIDEAFPNEIRAGTNGTEMKITLKNGSIWQLVGSDNFNSLVGSPPVGLTFSEYAIANPKAWDYLRPILAENGGWAVFISTPRGKNHFHELYEMARKNDAWFAEALTVEDTGAIPMSVIAEERRSGMTDDEIRQEYYVDFSAALKGAFYGVLMREAEEDGRIGCVRYDPALLVDTWWDLGIDDSMSIWFAQTHYNEVRLIDYVEHFGQGIPYYAKLLKEKPYTYGEHILPHDANVADLSTGRTRVQTLGELGITARVMPRVQNVIERIHAARLLIPRCHFDEEKCARGIEALRRYRSEYDEERNIFSQRPIHDEWSHGADSFGEGARAHQDKMPARVERYRYRRDRGGASWMSA